MNRTPPQPCEQCNLPQMDPRLREFINLILSRFREPVCICDWGRRAGLEPSELSRLCQETVGIAPKRLQMLLRISFSLSQLLTTDRQIKELGFDSGLPVVDTFIRDFEKICGVAPGKLREMVREMETEDGPPPASCPPMINPPAGLSLAFQID